MGFSLTLARMIHKIGQIVIIDSAGEVIMRFPLCLMALFFLMAAGGCKGTEERSISQDEDAAVAGDADQMIVTETEEPEMEYPEADDMAEAESFDDLIDTGESDDTDVAPIPVDPYGILMASGIFTLVYNGDGDMDTQINADMSGLVNQPVFTGTYGKKKKPIPGEPTEVVDAYTMSIAVRYGATAESPAIITVSQSTQDSTMALVNPAISFTLSVDGLEQGEHPLGFDPKGPDNIYLVNSINNDTDYCLLALSIGGTVTVTAAKDTDQPYGASLSFVGAKIPVFHPTETPLGDVVEQLVDIPICPKE